MGNFVSSKLPSNRDDSLAIRTQFESCPHIAIDILDDDWSTIDPPHSARLNLIKHLATHTSPFLKLNNVTCNPWVANAVQCCKESLHAAFLCPSPQQPLEIEEVKDDFFDEFLEVFEPNLMLKRRNEAATKSVQQMMEPLDTGEDISKKLSLTSTYTTQIVKTDTDDDCCSCASEATAALSEEEEEFSDSDQSHYYYNDEDDCYNEKNNCETTVDCLLRLAASDCFEPFVIYLEDYLCGCGECPQYKTITQDVQDYASKYSQYPQSKYDIKSVTRLLQAFSTYNEVVGYRSDMIATAFECLRLWSGDEDRAFTSIVMLIDEVPHLCTAEYA